MGCKPVALHDGPGWHTSPPHLHHRPGLWYFRSIPLSPCFPDARIREVGSQDRAKKSFHRLLAASETPWETVLGSAPSGLRGCGLTCSDPRDCCHVSTNTPQGFISYSCYSGEAVIFICHSVSETGPEWESDFFKPSLYISSIRTRTFVLLKRAQK